VIRVCVAGVTGWTGRPVAGAIEAADDLELVAGVARSDPEHFSTVAEALEAVPADVLVDYTHAESVGANVRVALERGVGVVVGSSGLTATDFDEIASVAESRGVGVIASGNFSITAALAQAAALLAARHVPHWEIVDYASATKPDAPSGTARELAERLGQVREPELALPVEETAGERDARGATIGGAQVHSLRLPSFTVSTEVVFALPDERLSIRHDAGSSAGPYVAGTLLAARAVPRIRGLVRGLDTLLLRQ
jgi:4-hydroxy-tetrahydrodipicolinate reductase